jgi:hypothetical protein
MDCRIRLEWAVNGNDLYTKFVMDLKMGLHIYSCSYKIFEVGGTWDGLKKMFVTNRKIGRLVLYKMFGMGRKMRMACTI